MHNAPRQPGQDRSMDAETSVPQEFVAVTEALRAALPHTRPELVLAETRGPARLAPHSFAVTATVTRNEAEIAIGRLVLLHDPAGQAAWEGTYRIACFARADVDPEMATDPVLPEVTWSWLEEALTEADADAAALGGTVTVTRSSRFGALADADPGDGAEDGGAGTESEVELRCSWSPRWDEEPARHLRAFCSLLADVAGLPPDIPGVVSIASRTRR